jgi:hypothetical protein
MPVIDNFSWSLSRDSVAAAVDCGLVVDSLSSIICKRPVMAPKFDTVVRLSSSCSCVVATLRRELVVVVESAERPECTDDDNAGTWFQVSKGFAFLEAEADVEVTDPVVDVDDDGGGVEASVLCPPPPALRASSRSSGV